MLFLLHLASKMELPEKGGGRVAIVLSGSPLFNGGAGSGESEIRRWLLENDLVEAIIALPTEIFFRTGIGTYLWILSNKKAENRRKLVQLINAADQWASIKNEGNKRRIISEEQIRQIAEIYAAAETNEFSRMLDYRVFGYRRIRVLRPLRMSLHINNATMENLKTEKVWIKLTDEQKEALRAELELYIDTIKPFAWAKQFIEHAAQSSPAIGKAGKSFVKVLVNAFGVRDADGEPVLDEGGEIVSDPDLTDYENVALAENVKDYFAREVLPHVPDAYIDKTFLDKADGQVGRVGYEINFNRFFYEYVPPRKLEIIDAELKQVEQEIADLLGEVTE